MPRRPSLSQRLSTQVRKRRREHPSSPPQAQRQPLAPAASQSQGPLQAERSPQAAGCPDPAMQRARQAGGPVDLACYSCQCGYLFQAPVTTTVACPHCHAAQAW